MRLQKSPLDPVKEREMAVRSRIVTKIMSILHKNSGKRAAIRDLINSYGVRYASALPADKLSEFEQKLSAL
jgi:hypothetical protein